MSEPMSDSIMETFTQLLKAQTDVLATQARAVSVQILPGLSCYTGEGVDATDGGFDNWLERFRERAVFAGWSSEEKHYQLKAHFNKTALNVFRMLPDQHRDTFDTAVSALKKRFGPADIEELRGLEFHHRTQGDGESIEQVGISIQQLGRKAFLSIIGKDFDCLLKGQFCQALMVKWQRKLGCTKPDVGFHKLLAQARMLEEHEKQFQTTNTLHAVNCYLKQRGHELPPLELTTVLWERRIEGRKAVGYHSSSSPSPKFWRQICLSTCFYTKQVVMIMPDSDQACLLSIKAIPLLGINVLQDSGKPIVSQAPTSTAECGVATMNWAEETKLPTQKGRVLKTKLSLSSYASIDLLFES